MSKRIIKNNRKILRSIQWAITLAWRFDNKVLILCCLLVSCVSILPAVALNFNEEIINALDRFILTGVGSFDNLLPTIITFGIITALAGLSNRLNEEFIYSIMFDSYYFGMEEILMDSVQAYTMKELLQKDTNDDFHSCVMREGALTDFISGSCTLFGKFLGFGSLLLVAVSMSKMIFIISIIYIIIVICYNLAYVEKLRMSWEKIRDKERLATYYEKMPQLRECAKELRIFQSGNYIINKWKDTYSTIYNYELNNNFEIELRTFFGGIGFYIFLASMIIYSLFLVANGKMTSDVLLVIFTLCMNLFTAVSDVTRMLTLTDYGLYALEQQYQFFGGNERKETKKGDQKLQPGDAMDTVFEARDLSFSYNGEKLALDHVSFSIKKGETVALVGMNGSGKSTLVKLLLQLYPPQSGELYFYGINYSQLDERTLRSKVGTFFQDFYLFHMSVKENIGFGDVKNISDYSKIECALEKGGAKEIVDKLPNGIETFIHKNIEKSGVDFSGGESQKLAVSRAYMNEKEILIFDEPASMLDPISELEQLMNIKDTVGGKTAILISHRIGFAQLADKIILMDQGRIVECGTHKDLIEKKGLYAKYFNEQAQWYQKFSV